jgi:hypothetical protein
MENLNIEEALLYFLYYKNFGEGDPTLHDLDKWSTKKNFDKAAFWETYENLIKRDYVHFSQDEASARLTPKGVLYTEKAGLVPFNFVARNRQARKQLINALATHLTTRGTYATVEQLVLEANLEGQYITGNIDLLVRMGYIRWIIPGVNLSINAKICAKQAEIAKAS